jgi:putative flippase GtrA
MRLARPLSQAHRDLGTQFIKYCIAGGTAFLVQLAVLEALVWLGTNATLAAGIGFACAVPVNYAIQRRLVFIVAGRHSRYFTRFVVVTLAALGLNTFLFWLISHALGLPNAASLVIVTGIMLFLNFLANRFITFAPAKTAPGGNSAAR